MTSIVLPHLFPSNADCINILVNSPLARAPPAVTIDAPTFRPALPGEPGDQRDLGVQVSAVDVEALPGGVPWLIPIALVLFGQIGVIHWLLTSLNINQTLQSLLASLWLPLQLPWLITRPFAQHIVLFSLLVFGLLLIATLVVVYRERLLAIATRWRTVSDAGQFTARTFPYRWVIFLTTTACYLGIVLFIPYPEGMNSTTGDEPHYLILAHSFYHDQDFDPVNNYQNQDYLPFHEDPALLPAIVEYNGQLVPYHARIGLPLIILPAYIIGGRIGVLIFLSICMSLSMVVLYNLFRAYLARTMAFTLVLLTGLTYPIVIFSHHIYTDTIGFMLVLFVLAQIFAPSLQDMRIRAFAVGFALAILPHLHYKLAPLSVGLYLFFLWQNRQQVAKALAWSVGPAVGMAVLLLAWLYAVYGDLSLGILGTQTDGDFTGQSQPDLPGAGIVGLFFDQAHGLVFYAPFYLLAFVGIWVGLRQRQTRSATLWLIATYAGYHLLVGVWRGWTGGISPTARQIFAALPILMLFTAWGVSDLWANRQWVQMIILAWLTILITLITIDNRLLTYGFAMTTNAILREELYAPGVAAWLPSFVQGSIGASYGLLLVNCIAVLICWWVCTYINAFVAWLLQHDRSIQKPALRSKKAPQQV